MEPWRASERNLCGAARLRNAHGRPLRDVFRGNLSWAQRYELTSIMKGHQGCVNTIQWSPDGRILCSGSDDRRINLWQYDAMCPSGAVAPICSLPTLHRHNIFDAQMTRCQQKVVSCGADGCVCVTYVESPESNRHLLYEPESGHHLASKLAFLPVVGPEVFMVTFGDGRVRMFDLREPCYRVVVNANGINRSSGFGLTAIEVRPTDGTIVAVGGTDPFLRLYDLRAFTLDRKDRPFSRAFCEQTPVLGLYTTPQLLDPTSLRRSPCSSLAPTSDIAISGVSWSPDGRQLLANYRSSDVVLFDMNTSAGSDGGATELSQEVQSNYNLPTDQVHFSGVRSFEGRVNEQTCAKEVRFLCGDSAVATGGDCGNLFIWETSTGKLLRKLPADRCVVNCIAPNPSQPTVCTSGIDAEIKVWDVGDVRVSGGSEARKRSSSDELASSSDWGRRRREGAPNLTAPEAEVRIKDAERKKHRGNGLVRQASWMPALEDYRAALHELHFEPPNEAIRREVNALAVSCHLNCALCHLSLQEYPLVVEEASRVLDIDEDNVKAYFRRASAFGEMREFDFAFDDVECALRREPDNAELLRLRAKLHKMHKAHQQRERNVYKRLFS